MYPILVVVIGIVVLVIGKRLSVLGGVVGALLGGVLLRFFPRSNDPVLQLLQPTARRLGARVQGKNPAMQ
jgi:hypothetical protein